MTKKRETVGKVATDLQAKADNKHTVIDQDGRTTIRL